MTQELQKLAESVLINPDCMKTWRKWEAEANPAAILELLDRLEKAEKDAERYRWLREQHEEDDGETLWHVRGETGPIDIGRLDKAIDDAMEASK